MALFSLPDMIDHLGAEESLLLPPNVISDDPDLSDHRYMSIDNDKYTSLLPPNYFLPSPFKEWEYKCRFVKPNKKNILLHKAVISCYLHTVPSVLSCQLAQLVQRRVVSLFHEGELFRLLLTPRIHVVCSFVYRYNAFHRSGVWAWVNKRN